MRFALLGLLAGGLFSAEVAMATPCASPIDQGAFDTAALKSELMVVALTCNERDDYNRFIMKFRPDLSREERALNSWFSRAYGHRARQEHDDYITALANSESQQGVHRGTLFCTEHDKLFPTVLGFRNIDEVVNFAAHRAQPQPVSLVSCAKRLPVKSPRRPIKTAREGH